MKIRIKDKLLTINHDENAENPRNWDNIAKFVLKHNRYNFPNELDINFNDFNSWGELKNALLLKYKPIEIVPIYLYDHHGLYIKIGDFYNEQLPQGHAIFDSGQIGFVLITKEAIKKAGLKYSKKIAKTIIEEEVKTYAKYISGEVYTYRLSKVVKCNLGHEHEEDISGCCGFYDIKDIIEDASNWLGKREAKFWSSSLMKLKEAYGSGNYD